MRVLKDKHIDDNTLFQIRISSALVSELKDVEELAKASGLEFPTAEIVESALKKALKTARNELKKSAHG